jgi:hypothetical protein
MGECVLEQEDESEAVAELRVVNAKLFESFCGDSLKCCVDSGTERLDQCRLASAAHCSGCGCDLDVDSGLLGSSVVRSCLDVGELFL